MTNRMTTTLAALMTLSLLSVANATSPLKPDNSRVNADDRASARVTAQDQSVQPDAAETTRLIRAELTADANLSTYGKNVKIIVIDDLITLKGPVNSEAERMKIVRTANNIAPTYRIQNQIQVTR